VKTQPLISEELAGFLESGISLTVASRDAELQAEVVRAWAARVDPDRRGLVLFLHAPSAAATLRNLEQHPELAVCVDRPSDNCSCQLKGRFTGSRPARASERTEVVRQTDLFQAELETIGIPRAMTAGLTNWPCVAVAMAVAAIYEQTPGPGAGEPLAPGAMPAAGPGPGGAP